ncbi:hypothetical protein IG631_11211 [Alternaria alternata]|nr:hypothetical protein IG631_11211 [Alternaria alternata]
MVHRDAPKRATMPYAGHKFEKGRSGHCAIVRRRRPGYAPEYRKPAVPLSRIEHPLRLNIDNRNLKL